MHLKFFDGNIFEAKNFVKNLKALQLSYRCEEPKKHWCYYSEQDLMAYMLRNADKTDCSFILADATGVGSREKALESYQWILCDISPVLRKILQESKNRKNNCVCIPITDLNFEAILSYAHTKSLPPYERLLDLLKSAIKYEIHELRKHIAYTIEKDWTKFRKSFSWVDILEAAHLFKQGEPELSQAMWQFIKEMKFQDMEDVLEYSIKDIVVFDYELFSDFFELLKIKDVRPLLLFKIVEAYVIKSIFNGKPPDSAGKIGNQGRDIVNFFLKQIDFSKMSHEEFINGPEKSTLLNDNMKNLVFNKILKEN